jgi:hypothetical protein
MNRIAWCAAIDLIGARPYALYAPHFRGSAHVIGKFAWLPAIIGGPESAALLVVILQLPEHNQLYRRHGLNGTGEDRYARSVFVTRHE